MFLFFILEHSTNRTEMIYETSTSEKTMLYFNTNVMKVVVNNALKNESFNCRRRSYFTSRAVCVYCHCQTHWRIYYTRFTGEQKPLCDIVIFDQSGDPVLISKLYIISKLSFQIQTEFSDTFFFFF